MSNSTLVDVSSTGYVVGVVFWIGLSFLFGAFVGWMIVCFVDVWVKVKMNVKSMYGFMFLASCGCGIGTMCGTLVNPGRQVDFGDSVRGAVFVGNFVGLVISVVVGSILLWNDYRVARNCERNQKIIVMVPNV